MYFSGKVLQFCSIPDVLANLPKHPKGVAANVQDQRWCRLVWIRQTTTTTAVPVLDHSKQPFKCEHRRKILYTLFTISASRRRFTALRKFNALLLPNVQHGGVQAGNWSWWWDAIEIVTITTGPFLFFLFDRFVSGNTIRHVYVWHVKHAHVRILL